MLRSDPHLYLSIVGLTRIRIRGVLRDALVVQRHGGFIYSYSNRSRRKVWITKSPARLYIYDDTYLRVYRFRGPLQCLKLLNQWEFLRLKSWRASIHVQLNENRRDSAIASEINRQLAITDNWTRAFSNWFLTNRIPIPKAQTSGSANSVNRLGSQSLPPKPVIKVIYRKSPIYKIKHFKEVDKLSEKLKQKDALDLVSEKYHFKRESFEKQYRTRWLNKKTKGEA